MQLNPNNYTCLKSETYYVKAFFQSELTLLWRQVIYGWLKMNILIIEDGVTSGRILSKILEKCGNVTIATDGRLGLNCFRDALNNMHPFDLILLDIMMPEIDGQEVLKEIRKIEEKNKIFGFDTVRIIMITALDDNKNILLAFRSQCEGYLVKPLTKDKVLKEVKRLFQDFNNNSHIKMNYV